jgi:pyridoxine kinase
MVAAQQRVVYTRYNMMILSFQSAVAHGHVGNSAAAFALQRLGFDLVRLDSVHFSNHPGHGRFTGRVVPADELDRLVNGLDALGVPAQLDAVVSGYLGEAQSARPLARLVKAMKAARPGALYLCDPVMGDDGGGLYVAPEVVDAMAQLLGLADIITPNRFELETLSGMPARTLDQARAAARTLRGKGPGLVVTTSLSLGPDSLSCLLDSAQGAWLVTTPRIDFAIPPNGAGDLLSALLLARLARGENAPDALAAAVSSVHGVLSETHRLNRREMALAQAQEQLVAPTRLFKAEKL